MYERHYPKIIMGLIVLTGIFAVLYMGVDSELSKTKRDYDILWEVADELHAELELTVKLNLNIDKIDRISSQTYAVLLRNGSFITAESYIANATLNWRIIPTVEGPK